MRLSGKATMRDVEQLMLFRQWLIRVSELEKSGVKDPQRQACVEVYGDENCKGNKE